MRRRIVVLESKLKSRRKRTRQILADLESITKARKKRVRRRVVVFEGKLKDRMKRTRQRLTVL